MAQHTDEVIQAAKSLYLKGNKVGEIYKTLKVPKRTVYHWRDVGHWDDMLSNESALECVARRYVLLVGRDDKSDGELKEMDRLLDHQLRLREMHVREMEAANEERDAGKPIVGGRKRKPNRKRGKIIKNDVSHLTAKDFEEKFHKHYYEYQHELRQAKLNPKTCRNRNILKSRQIGATWYFAQEAFEDACLTGDNQIFISATRRQADVFRRYIIAIAKEKFDIELKGSDEIILHTAGDKKASLIFLSTNSKSAQSHHGHVYIYEYFWISKFEELYTVASAMASHKKWRRTLFSTPSAVTHEGYARWTGDLFNRRWKTKNKRKEFPSFKEMQAGVLCPDKVWRKIITLDDAEKGGCDLFDIEELKLEYSADEYRNLYMCKFVDNLQAVFRLNNLEACYADPEDWDDFDIDADRPFDNYPVWGGYDPSRNRDDASFVIVAPSPDPDGKFRILARYKWVNKSYSWQAGQIEKLTKKYNFVHLGVDITGPGAGVFESVKAFFPAALPIYYSVATKTSLVLKAKDVIENGRIEWDMAQSEDRKSVV